MTAAPSAASNGARGKGMFRSVEIGPRRKPADPASVNWASDTWPVYPVITTYDRAIIEKMKLMISALRHEPSKSTSTATPAPVPSTVGRIRLCGLKARPTDCSVIAPRVGSGVERTTSTMRMSERGISSCAAVVGSPSHLEAKNCASDWSIPMARPAATAGRVYWKPPTSAAARAGMMNRL